MMLRLLCTVGLAMVPTLALAADDGARRRDGISALVGRELVADGAGNHLGATMYGLDVRLGRQLGDTVGVYVPLHLSMGSFDGLGTVGGVPAGLTGTFAATLVVDATFADRLFAGGGAGIGILNNPTGPAIHLRAGGYPLVGSGEGSRRKGLAVAGDLRLIYAKGIHATYPTISIGYEAF